MQKTIESFFKHSSFSKTLNFDDIFEGIRVDKQPEIKIKYTRQSTREEDPTNDGLTEEESGKFVKLQTLNKKRKYAQFHLELGQSDFLLHTCKTCGITYAKGDVTDEKVHTTFHKNFTLGIPFKGWRHENVINLPVLEKDRIILISSCGSALQRKKIEEVVNMMEIELGDGWIFNELCKVYLFVSLQRVAGCAIVEAISAAHKILTDSVESSSDRDCEKHVISKSKALQFGGVCFQREVHRKGSSHKNVDSIDSNLLGSIVCEEESRPASCGIRAIWVSPSNRRKRIATHLLDAVRKSFSTDGVLERSQLAFSVPTFEGKALATKYAGTGSFLVYKI